MTKRPNITLVGMLCPSLREQPFPLTRYAAVHEYTDTGMRPTRKQLPTLHITDFPRRNPTRLAYALAATLVCMLTAMVLWVTP